MSQLIRFGVSMESNLLMTNVWKDAGEKVNQI